MIRIFKVSIPGSAVVLLFSEAILVLSCYVVACYATLDIPADVFLDVEGGWLRIAIVDAFILLGLYFNDLYEDYRILSRTELLQQFSLVLGGGFLLQAVLTYGRLQVVLPLRVMLGGSLLVLIF